MAKCAHPDCEVALGLTATDLGLLCGLHLEHAKDIIRGEQRLIDAEQRIAELEAKLAALDWQPITESNLPSTEDEVGGWVEGKWRSQNILTAIEEFGTAHIDWSKTLVTHRRPLNPPAQP